MDAERLRGWLVAFGAGVIVRRRAKRRGKIASERRVAAAGSAGNGAAN